MKQSKSFNNFHRCSTSCEEKKSVTENKEEITAAFPPHKKRKKTRKRKLENSTNQQSTNQQSKITTKSKTAQKPKTGMKKNNSLIDLHTDALQYVLEFISLDDRAKHIALTCKHLRILHNKALIHVNHFGNDIWKKLSKHPNNCDLAKRFRMQSLEVCPRYNMELMCVLANKTHCLCAQKWNDKSLYIMCENATCFYFGNTSAYKMLTTHQKPLSLVSFSRNLKKTEPAILLRKDEWTALEKCVKCISSFELHLLITMPKADVTTELCCESLLKVSNLLISVYKDFPGFDSSGPMRLFVQNNCFLPNLRSLEIQYWSGALYWQSLEMPNLQELIINIVGSVAINETGAEQFTINHVLDSVILIMNVKNCKLSLKSLKLQTKELTVVYENYDFGRFKKINDPQLYKFIAGTQCNLQYERLVIRSYDDNRKNDLIKHKRFYLQPRPKVVPAETNDGYIFLYENNYI